MIKKLIKVLILLLVFSCVLTSMVMSRDVHHLGHCIEQKCPKCAIILFARSISELLKLVLLESFLIVLIHYIFYQKIICIVKEIIFKSLLNQKVQFNE